MADAVDSKSTVRKGVRVRIPPRAPTEGTKHQPKARALEDARRRVVGCNRRGAAGGVQPVRRPTPCADVGIRQPRYSGKTTRSPGIGRGLRIGRATTKSSAARTMSDSPTVAKDATPSSPMTAAQAPPDRLQDSLLLRTLRTKPTPVMPQANTSSTMTEVIAPGFAAPNDSVAGWPVRTSVPTTVFAAKS